MVKITTMQLSIGQTTQIKTDSINLNYFRSSVLGLSEKISIDSIEIKIPPLCEIFVSQDESCSGKIVNQQVI